MVRVHQGAGNQHAQQGGLKLTDAVQQLLRQHLHMNLSQVTDCPMQCVTTHSLLLLVYVHQD